MEASVPSLANENDQKIVYLISPDFNTQHISKLILKLENSSIKLRLQKQTDSLGIIIKERTFVLVDNYSGQVTLGSQFSSLMMFIVGYPKIGKNKKNHYCRTPDDVISKFNYFSTLPSYEKKIYRSSSVISRSRIGSGHSIRANSSINQSKSVAQAAKSLKEKWFEARSKKGKENKESLAKIDQNSKLFLYMRSEDEYFLKVALKIAANNPIKFKTVEDINELEISLDICRSRNNYGVVDAHFIDEVMPKKFFNIKWLVYSPGEGNFPNKHTPKNIIQTCFNEKELIDSIRSLGFQAVSIKDIDKSIVKYDNPFAMQKQILRRQLKKKQLHWTSSQKKLSQKFAPTDEFANKMQTQIQISHDKPLQAESQPFVAIKPKRQKKVTKYYNDYYLNTNIDCSDDMRSGASIQDNCIKKTESQYSIHQKGEKISKQNSVKGEQEVKKIRRIFSSDFQKKKGRKIVENTIEEEQKKSIKESEKSKKIRRIRRIVSKGDCQNTPIMNQFGKGGFKSENSSSINGETSKITDKLSEKSSKRSLRLRSANPAFYEIKKQNHSCQKISLKCKQASKSPSLIRKKQLITRQEYYINPHKPNELSSIQNNPYTQTKPFFKTLNHNSTAETNEDCQEIQMQTKQQCLPGLSGQQIKNMTFGGYHQLNHYDQFLKYELKEIEDKIVKKSICVWKQENFEIEMCIEKMKEREDKFEEMWSFKFLKRLQQVTEDIVGRLLNNSGKQEIMISFFIDEENLLQELMIIRKKLYKKAKKFPKIGELVRKINIFVIAKSSSKQEFKKSVSKVVESPKIKEILTLSIYETNFKPLYITDFDNYIEEQVKPSLVLPIK